jgi:rRNA pseudouridine-1189 N-methylase Emg1 (Nep1/Mra1 family)
MDHVRSKTVQQWSDENEILDLEMLQDRPAVNAFAKTKNKTGGNALLLQCYQPIVLHHHLPV